MKLIKKTYWNIVSGKDKLSMENINIEVVDCDNQRFKDLRPEWNDLLKRSYSNTIFLTWEWLYSWWLVYFKNKELNIICVRDDNNKLIGIAPLFIHETKYYKVPVVELSFLGDKVSDRQDFIIDKKHPEVYETIIGYLFTKKNWDIARLEQVPEWSLLLSHKQFNKAYEIEMESRLPFLDISLDWGTYSKGLSKKFKRDLNHKYNVLKREGEWKFANITNPISIEGELEKIFKIEMDSKKKTAGYALFADERARHFHKEFSKYCMENGCLSISYIKLNGSPISYLLGYRHNNKYLAYNMAYNPEYYRASPGKLVLHETLKHCFDKNLQEFDFLRGDTYIKNLWTEKKRTNYRIVFFNRGLRAKLLKTVVFGIRPIIKNHLTQGKLGRLIVRKSVTLT